MRSIGGTIEIGTQTITRRSNAQYRPPSAQSQPIYCLLPDKRNLISRNLPRLYRPRHLMLQKNSIPKLPLQLDPVKVSIQSSAVRSPNLGSGWKAEAAARGS